MSVKKESCAGCRYAHELAAQPAAPLGIVCRRYPPTFFQTAMPVPRTPANPQGIALGAASSFPPTAPENWCGEWAAKIVGVVTN